MNEEEKQAYNYLEKYINWETLGERNLEGDIKTILNLIEKQQKEIEDLKAITKTYEAYAIEEDGKIVIASKEYFINGFFKDFLSNYVSKDKIEEKIKELESHIWKDGYMGKFDRYAIHYLKELLGE